MDQRSSFSILLLLGAVIFAACNSSDSKRRTVASQQPQTGQIETTYADGIKRVTIQELENLRASGKVFIVDVRNQAAYDEGHIPGAKLIPLGEVVTRLKEFPRDKQIVMYCS